MLRKTLGSNEIEFKRVYAQRFQKNSEDKMGVGGTGWGGRGGWDGCGSNYASLWAAGREREARADL